MEDTKKPRAHFCWECGNELRFPYFVEIVVEGHSRILHKACADGIRRGCRTDPDGLMEVDKNRPKSPRRRKRAKNDG